jgi:hypothetical protein
MVSYEQAKNRAERGDLCNICGKEMGTGRVADENCGGDCLECMALVGEDPDCWLALAKSLKDERDALIRALEKLISKTFNEDNILRSGGLADARSAAEAAIKATKAQYK